MYKLSQKQIGLLNNSNIVFSYNADHDSSNWLNEGLVAFPEPDILVEEYAGFFTRTSFYSCGSLSYSWSPFNAPIKIARYCSIAGGVEVMPFAHPTHMFTTSSMIYDGGLSFRKNFYKNNSYSEADLLNVSHPTNGRRVNIGNDVYIASSAKIRGGVRIGDGAIVGAYSVVTKDVEPYSVVVGNPARVVRKRYTDKQIIELLSIQWWNYNFHDIVKIASVNGEIDRFIDSFWEGKVNNRISAFNPRVYRLSDLLGEV